MLSTPKLMGVIINFNRKLALHDRGLDYYAAGCFWILAPVNMGCKFSFSALLFYSFSWLRYKNCISFIRHWCCLMSKLVNVLSGHLIIDCHKLQFRAELPWRPCDPNDFASRWRRDPDPNQFLRKREINLSYVRLPLRLRIWCTFITAARNDYPH